MFITHYVFKIIINYSRVKKSIIREIKNTVKGTNTGNREILDTWN